MHICMYVKYFWKYMYVTYGKIYISELNTFPLTFLNLKIFHENRINLFFKSLFIILVNDDFNTVFTMTIIIRGKILHEVTSNLCLNLCNEISVFKFIFHSDLCTGLNTQLRFCTNYTIITGWFSVCLFHLISK